MGQGNILVSALREEDRLLRQVLASVPELAGWARRASAIDPVPACKETLAHLAYWDMLTVHHCRCRLRGVSGFTCPSHGFDEMDAAEIERAGGLTFAAVLGEYQEASRSLISFLDSHWPDLSRALRCELRVPVRHRRHHRIALTQILGLNGCAGLRDVSDIAAVSA